MKLYRIIKIKKGKNVYGGYVVNSDGKLFKVVFEKDEFDKYGLSIGSTFLCDLVKSENKFTGEQIFIPKNINKIKNPNQATNKPYDQIKFSDKKNLNKNFISSITGGDNLRNWEFRQQLIKELKNELIKYGYNEYYTPTLMDKRGSSIVSPLVTNTKYQGEKYLKITHEMLLKKVSYITLKSLFEIGYLSRNVNDGKDSLLSYLSLEAIGTSEIDLKLNEFYEFVLKKTIELCKEFKIQIRDGIDKLRIYDILSLYLCSHKTFDKKEFIEYYNKVKLENKNKNVILINAPLNSPLALPSEYGIPLETKWIINGSSVGHGYFGQTDADILLDEFKKQKEKLEEKNIVAEIDDDFIRLVKIVGIETFSFNLGLDRYLYNIFNFDNAQTSSKILGI